MSAGTLEITAQSFQLLQKPAGSIRIDAKIKTVYFTNNSRRETTLRLPDYRPYEELFRTYSKADPSVNGIFYSGDTAFFLKKKYCRFGKKCPIQGHWYKKKHLDSNFPKTWVQRRDTRFMRQIPGLKASEQAHGTLPSLLYEFKKINLKPGTVFIRNIAHKGRLFRATAEILEREDLELPAGNFSALKIRLGSALTFSPHLKDSKKMAAGFIGMEGDLLIWLEEKHGYILKIEGSIPIKAIKKNVKIVIELTSRETSK